MTFQVVRTSDPLCEPNCPEWIYAAGSIERSTPAKFRKFIKALGHRHLPMIITSSGGYTDSSLMIGREVRKLKLDIAIGEAEVTPCKSSASICRKRGYLIGKLTAERANCDSGCTFIFAGGVNRINNSSTYVGVHRGEFFWDASKSSKLSDAKKVELAAGIEKDTWDNIRSYLSEMGIDPGFAEKSYESVKMFDMPIDLQLQYKLATAMGFASDWAGPGVCKVKAPPGNCILESD